VRRLDVRVGSILGIRLSLHVSWIVVFVLVVWVTTAGFAEIYPGISAATRLLMGFVTGMAFFVCLTLHELAHAVTARRFGIEVRGIMLFLFGGVAEIEGEVPTPAREFAVALVGPAVSVVLGAALALATRWTGSMDWAVAEGVLGTLALVNLGIAVFNLVPGLPLDGGRLLRAGLWRLTGSYARATRIAAAGGAALGVLLAAFGLVLAIAGGEPAGLWYLPMGAFLWVLARAAGRSRGPAVVPGALALHDREGEAPQPGP
jgi:Zn-dependent protease